MNGAHVSTHVLDAAEGRPAVGVAVQLLLRDGDAWTDIAGAVTDDDGRVARLGGSGLVAGEYRLRFATGAYFAERARPTFYPEVVITFDVGATPCHVPLLLSPFAYSTYRGS